MDDIGQKYTLTFEQQPEYLLVFAKGDLSHPDTRVHAWERIISRCRLDKCTKLLVVQDSPGNATPADAYTSSSRIVAIGLEGIKIAFVDLNPAHYEHNQFGELVAANRGAFAKVFTTEAEGRNWLLMQPA